MKLLPLLLAALAVASVARAAEPPRTPGADCPPGAYRAADGDIANLVRTAQGQRVTRLNGLRGDPAAADAPLRCDGGTLKGRDGRPWTKLSFKATEVDFDSAGTQLHGVLLLPPAGAAKPPLIVLVHGSEHASPRGTTYQQMFTAQGVATFAYDKRGTGRSRGVYTQDFVQLADDAAAAVEAARRACPDCFSRVGLHGGSQGGWVAPLAAVKAKADFLEVSFGVVGTPLEQDQWQVDYQLKDLGFTPDAGVHAVTEATARAAASDFTEGLDALEAAVRAYRDQPWFAKLDGQYTGQLVRGEIERARSESPAVPWRYDSEAVLRRLKIPTLWVFAQEDSVAPSAPSIARLERLRREGLDATIAVYPHTDHGISTFVATGPGQRKTTGIADGYLRLIADWAKGTVQGRYGEAVWPDGGR
ncbi:alpha/beta hydrolase [Caulobacter sp. CCUG 60055]|uniref:alpha/beta hydrolase family protein n=1 Tax=Caulobacter sp. CCUG 60055 TaxID=2100090 RepID=UPI001FA7B901|nr:alpha/beta hydrolase [Caulobacter sp. CCUG 60055]MBQ1541371.1 alpha/beta hydrolase [Caulobacteraceae bacterium]MCI3182011.1 alpha/beta hydrolase [Caulobacter sp. CCUG 60055]